MFQGISWDFVDSVLRRDVEACLESLFTKRPIGLVMTGVYGTGKTALLYLIWADFIRRGIRWLPGPDDLKPEFKERHWIDDTGEGIENFLKYAHGAFKEAFCLQFLSHWDLVAELRTNDDGVMLSKTSPLFRVETNWGFKPVLMIDDLGRGFDDKSGWNLSLADEFFNWRWEHNLPVIVTTNKTAQELRSWPGWERIVDRLADPNYTIATNVGGKSKRSTEFLKRKRKG